MLRRKRRYAYVTLIKQVSKKTCIISQVLTFSELQAAERAARDAQDRAKEAKKAFKQAKGEACATRPGGKL